MREVSQFRFKRFSVWHHRSAMKVGVDGVLIGCWAETDGATKILDVGTGCGLIALIMAQRCPDATITGIDIDSESAEEAKLNAKESPWSERIRIMQCSFRDLTDDSNSKFDLIISNPPYFDSGVADISTRREQARHQGVLSPSAILEDGRKILNDGGEVAIIVPTELAEGLEAEAEILGYALTKKCLVRGHAEAPLKRALLQWKSGVRSEVTGFETLTLETSSGVPTDEYRTLCKDFYLKF